MEENGLMTLHIFLQCNI